MSKELVREIEKAQSSLHDEVCAALRKFTAETGMCVPSMTWRTTTVADASGRTKAVEYWHVSSDLCTGLE